MSKFIPKQARIYSNKPTGKLRIDGPVGEDLRKWDNLINTIPTKAIYTHPTFRAFLYRRDVYKAQEIETILKGELVVSFGLLVGLVHPVVCSKLKSKAHFLKGYSPMQLHLLLSAWCCYKINKGLFKASQILPFKGATYEVINYEINNLKRLGVIEQLSEEEIYKLTGKVVFNGGARKYHYYKFTRKGSS